ncbi:MAG TPA: pyridoxamine 5'-phosphate oxidase, partial [Alteromonas australica]|nr:pyridoxamine 5'-phosphate oxidase [Alteromonas australica]
MPGHKHILEIKGAAEIRDDEDLLQGFEVQGKTPSLVTRVAVTSKHIKLSAAIENAALWPAENGPEDLVPAEIFKAHIKQSSESSLQAKV